MYELDENYKKEIPRTIGGKEFLCLAIVHFIIGIFLVVIVPSDVMKYPWAQDVVSFMSNIAHTIANYDAVQPHGRRQFIAASSLLFALLALFPVLYWFIANFKTFAVSRLHNKTRKQYKKMSFALLVACAATYFILDKMDVNPNLSPRGAILMSWDLGAAIWGTVCLFFAVLSVTNLFSIIADLSVKEEAGAKRNDKCNAIKLQK